jgi:hypothetical protein
MLYQVQHIFTISFDDLRVPDVHLQVNVTNPTYPPCNVEMKTTSSLSCSS